MTITGIVTMTRAVDEHQARALAADLEKLRTLGLPIFAADASTVDFCGMVNSFPGVRIWPEGHTLVRQIDAAMRRAKDEGHRYVLYTEPDKRAFFVDSASSFINRTAQLTGA